MKRPVRSLLIVSSRFPFAAQEGFLAIELEELAKHFERVAVVPVRPPASAARYRVPDTVEVLRWPLLDANIARRAARMMRTRPAASMRALSSVVTSRDGGAIKNCLALPKALAIAQWVLEQRFDHIHAYWMSTPATVAMVAGAVSGVPWSATAHRWDIYERNAFDVKERTASFVRAISTRGAVDLQKRMQNMNGRIIEVRLGTVVPPRTAAVAPDSAEFHIVCPALLVPVKGHEVLLQALAILRRRNVPIRCTLCGDGPLREKIINGAATLGISDIVEFAGYVPQERLHAWYREKRFAAVVLASRTIGKNTMEGVPATLIEAMAFGVPVVASDSGSVGELVDERCGRLVPPDDAHALANAILEVYGDPRAARERAERAYERVAAEYDVLTQMRRLAAAFQEVG